MPNLKSDVSPLTGVTSLRTLDGPRDSVPSSAHPLSAPQRTNVPAGSLLSVADLRHGAFRGPLLSGQVLSSAKDGVLIQLTAPDGTARRIFASTTLPLTVGERLALAVIAPPTETTQPVLLRVLSPAERTAIALEEAQRRTLRHALTRQLPLAKALEALLSASPSDVTRSDVLAVIPTLRQLLRPGGLRRTVERSGVFFEHRLAREVASLPTDGPERDVATSDLKFALLKHAQSPPTPASESEPTNPTNALQAFVAAALARLRVLQIANLPSEDAPAGDARHWHLELPFINGHDVDAVVMTIERGRTDDATGEDEIDAPGRPRCTTWAITVSFELTPGEPVSARLTLSEDRLGVQFSSAFAGARQRIGERTDVLRRQLQAVGVDVDAIECVPPPSRTPFGDRRRDAQRSEAPSLEARLVRPGNKPLLDVIS